MPIDLGGCEEFADGHVVFRALSAEDAAVAGLDGLAVARIDGKVFAVRNRCSHQERPMDGGQLVAGSHLRCPHHGVCFDLRSGAIVWDAGYLGLEPCEVVEVIERDGRVIALPNAPADGADQPTTT